MESKEIVNRNRRREQRRNEHRTRLERLADNTQQRPPPRQISEGRGLEVAVQPPMQGPEGDVERNFEFELYELSLQDFDEIKDRQLDLPEPETPPTLVINEPNCTEPIYTSRGRRIRKPTRLIETMYVDVNWTIKHQELNHQFLMAMKWNKVTDLLKSADLKALLNWIESYTDVNVCTIEEYHPMFLATQANASDNPTWEEAVNGPDSNRYWEVMEKEVAMLQKEMDCWEVVDREDFMNVLPSTWAKRFPNGEVRKLKARFCARDDKQIQFFDTFAPVTNWTIVRIMLIMSLILGLSTKQVDYTAAFTHAAIDKPPNYEL